MSVEVTDNAEVMLMNGVDLQKNINVDTKADGRTQRIQVETTRFVRRVLIFIKPLV